LADGELHISHTNNVKNRFEEVRARIDQLRQLMENGGLTAVVNELFPDEEVRVRDIRAIMMAALEESPDLTIQQFLGAVSDAITKPEIPENVEEVRVMSLHKSKGLSSPVTIIAGCVEGLLPRQPGADLSAQETLASIEEQRRLFYVGITRVKAAPPAHPGHLILTSAREMPVAAARRAGITPAQQHYGQAKLLPSRFLGEFDGNAPPTEQG
jgi:superfamily I DNA/RNA helicase